MNPQSVKYRARNFRTFFLQYFPPLTEKMKKKFSKNVSSEFSRQKLLFYAPEKKFQNFVLFMIELSYNLISHLQDVLLERKVWWYRCRKFSSLFSHTPLRGLVHRALHLAKLQLQLPVKGNNHSLAFFYDRQNNISNMCCKSESKKSFANEVSNRRRPLIG